jgi:hypothetical protein
MPRITGPVTQGSRAGAFGRFFGDIGALGYVEEEYFLEGEATRFSPVGDLGSDGRWTVVSAGTAPYKTRILVRRPIDPTKFNGTVLVEWANVTSGYEISFADPRGLYDGFAYVAVSAQKIGLDGFQTTKQGLRSWDPARYGSLSHPGDSYSYDIFTQAGRVLGPERGELARDPLAGLEVRKLIAIGGSQSAARLTSYINAIQPREKLFDALMPVVSFGNGSGFDDLLMDVPAMAKMSPEQLIKLRNSPTRLRGDLSARVMVVNSETEAMPFYPVRQADSDRFRYWEVAGGSHAPTAQMKMILEKTERDAVASASSGGHHASDVMWLPVADAAIRHVHNWINGGPPPPAQSLIEITGTPIPTIVRDGDGNARGGVRLPDLEVPIARYAGNNGSNGMASIAGLTDPFSAAKLRQLYPSHEDYVLKVVRAAHLAEARGVIPAYRRREYCEQAKAATVPT